MKRRDFNTLIDSSKFKELFITYMGWNQVYGQTLLPKINIDGVDYRMENISERNGFQILTCKVDIIPNISTCKKIDIRLRRIAFDYICIYYVENTTHHQWVSPVKKNGKRDIVAIEYDSSTQADFLFSKIDGLSFKIDAVTTITDVKEKIQSSFALNSEKVTKNFYAGFKKAMKGFTKRISGVFDDVPSEQNKCKQWYASIMLNRLLFCYFIQKKGFLNNDSNYLRTKLEWVRAERGANRFYDTFYKGFLTRLFQDGLNSPIHNRDFESIYGRIPFLNGGLFGQHITEKNFPDINIEDNAFQELFDFLDTWNWHLDTRLESDQKDINPDVLGYIFEQYVNDKAEMGAYYTQEDITEQISKNCILPYILGKLLCQSEYDIINGYASSILKQNPANYIYDSIKYGYSEDWKDRLPNYISIGLKEDSENILSLRQRWGEKPLPEFGLKKESWRDTIERFQRCDEIIDTITNGGISSIKDFITFNIDIRKFALDLIINSNDATFIKTYYQIVNTVKILDLACGSGAFLFASMNILEPIYEELLGTMLTMQERDPHLFAEQSNIFNNFRKNPQFYIYTEIALKNLYGVDIMREAVETAKLRLFLKMASVLDVNTRAYNMGLDPLPDLDFNLFSGNSLTGDVDLSAVSIHTNTLEEFLHLRNKFNDLQLFDHNNMDEITSTKRRMNKILLNVEKSLNHIDPNSNDLESLIANERPFHWVVSFYSIMKNGGFDVIVGNPPYRENNRLSYSVANYDTADCGNVYTCMMERALDISRSDSYVGMIVQLPIVCTDRMKSAQQLLLSKECWLYNFDDRPGKLFENLQHIRATIVIMTGNKSAVFSSKYNRWYTETRNVLFNSLTCVPAFFIPSYISIPKVGSKIVKSILQKISGNQSIKAIAGTGNKLLYYHNAPLYFTRGTNFLPYFSNDRGDSISSSVKTISFSSEEERDICCCLLNSSLFYMWFVLFSDCRHLNVREIENFPLGFSHMKKDIKDKLVELCQELMEDLNHNKIRKVTNGARNGRVEFDEFKPKPSKPIFDKIDALLAEHYHFTPIELDYIVNYDVKFRMNDDV